MSAMKTIIGERSRPLVVGKIRRAGAIRGSVKEYSNCSMGWDLPMLIQLNRARIKIENTIT